MVVLGVKVNANDGSNDGRPEERVVWKCWIVEERNKDGVKK